MCNINPIYPLYHVFLIVFYFNLFLGCNNILLNQYLRLVASPAPAGIKLLPGGVEGRPGLCTTLGLSSAWLKQKCFHQFKNLKKQTIKLQSTNRYCIRLSFTTFCVELFNIKAFIVGYKDTPLLALNTWWSSAFLESLIVSLDWRGKKGRFWQGFQKMLPA